MMCDLFCCAPTVGVPRGGAVLACFSLWIPYEVIIDILS